MLAAVANSLIIAVSCYFSNKVAEVSPPGMASVPLTVSIIKGCVPFWSDESGFLLSAAEAEAAVGNQTALICSPQNT